MNEEALIAVKVATYESGSEVNRVRDEYNSKYKHNTSELSLQVRTLQAEAEVHSSRLEQSSLCLNHLLVYTASLQHKYDALHSVYHTLHTVHQKDLKLIRGLDSLASCCNLTSAHSTHSTHTSPTHTNTTSTDTNHTNHHNHTNRKHTQVYQFEPFLDPLEEVVVRSGKVTFRVAVLYVLAALRFRRCMREARVYSSGVSGASGVGSGVGSGSGGNDGVLLPPVYVLRESSSSDIARMLLHAARTANTTSTHNTTSSIARHLHSEMSMDEFDAYIADYEQKHTSRATGGGGGGGMGSTSGSKRQGGDRRSLLQVLGSPSRTTRSRVSGSGSGIYQLQNVGVLNKTLTDMSSTIAKDKAEIKQLEVGVDCFVVLFHLILYICVMCVLDYTSFHIPLQKNNYSTYNPPIFQQYRRSSCPWRSTCAARSGPLLRSSTTFRRRASSSPTCAASSPTWSATSAAKVTMY